MPNRLCETCRNTREATLARDAIVDQFGIENLDEKVTELGCKNYEHKWLDPYSGKDFTDPRELDTDHVVPLGNAHSSGGWGWDREKREQYANYMKNNYHLLNVLNSENRGKGLRPPQEYMPPNDGFLCEYINIWMRIKDEWRLDYSCLEMVFLLDCDDACQSGDPAQIKSVCRRVGSSEPHPDLIKSAKVWGCPESDLKSALPKNAKE